MTQLEKQLNQIFIDVGSGSMARVGKTEANTIETAPITVERNFIDMEETETEITGFNVTSNYPYSAQIGDEVFDYLFNEFYSMNISQGRTTGLVVFQQPATGGTGNMAWQFNAQIIINSYDMVAGLLTFDLKYTNIVTGTATMTAGEPIFTPDTGTLMSKIEENKETKE